jgi:hypothetical protein
MMDSAGTIRAFAKVARSADVATLLTHEAQVLRRLESLGLRTAAIPRVLWSGRVANATALVTDTLKTASSRSPTELTPAHLEFARELALRTQGPMRTLGEIAGQFRLRVDRVGMRVGAQWRQRLIRATDSLAREPQLQVRTSLSHGDFTPWNTFLCGRTLYVFDWEYAADESLPGHDIVHFALSVSKAPDARARYEAARQQLLRARPELDAGVIDACLAAYLLSLCLRFIERAPISADGSIAGWEREADHAALLDYALAAHCTGS